MSPMGKRADIGWFASHRHDAAGSNEPYAYSYLFAYAIDVPSSASTFTLPRNHLISTQYCFVAFSALLVLSDSRSFMRALCNCDLLLPMEHPSMVAISLCSYPSTSCSTKIL